MNFLLYTGLQGRPASQNHAAFSSEPITYLEIRTPHIDNDVIPSGDLVRGHERRELVDAQAGHRSLWGREPVEKVGKGGHGTDFEMGEELLITAVGALEGRVIRL